MRCLELPEQNYKDNLRKVKLYVIKLENRLDVANKKFGDVITDNGYLREAVNHLLQDRYLKYLVKVIYRKNIHVFFIGVILMECGS